MRHISVGLGARGRRHRDRQQARERAAPRAGVDRVGHLRAVGADVVAAVVARRGQPAPAHAEAPLHRGAAEVVPVERRLDPDAPRTARGIDAPAADLAPDLHEVVAGPRALDQRRQQIDRVALGHGVEVELHARIRLHQASALDAHLPAPHEAEDRIDVGRRIGRTSGKAPRLDERLDRDVVHAAAERPHAVREPQAVGDVRVHRIGAVVVQPAQQRLLLEDRHRGPRLAVEPQRGVAQLPGGHAAHVSRHAERGAQHHALRRDVPAARRASAHRERRRGAERPNTVFHPLHHGSGGKFSVFRRTPEHFAPNLPQKGEKSRVARCGSEINSYLCRTLWRYSR